MPRDICVLFLADSHLGFDLPLRPRVRRRRRGHDFLANYRAALDVAIQGGADLLVHGGDVFHRSRVPSTLAYQALEPLVRIADRGVPVFIVPGNHERSRLPHLRFASHPRVQVFDRPRAFAVDVRGTRVVVAGFPFVRREVRGRFPQLLERTGWRREGDGPRLLCMHQCVEGATVGPGDFTFTRGPDVVRARDLPGDFAAVLSGHVHRHQVLTTDLRGQPLAAPVLYPGSVERTSYAEVGEEKGYMLVHLTRGGGSPRARWDFQRLPARPMIVRELDVESGSPGELERTVRDVVAAAPADAVLRIRLNAPPGYAVPAALSSVRVRALAPKTMNVEIRPGRGSRRARRQAAPERMGTGARRQRDPGAELQLELGSRA